MNIFESITKPLRWLMALLLVAFVAGCGGGGDSGSNIISGVASKGPINGSNVCAYAISGGAQGAQIGSCSTTDSAGNYSINLGSYTGPVLLEATGGNYVDEATAATVSLVSLRSMLPNATGVATSVAVTPLTELAYQVAQAAGGLSDTNIQAAINNVQSNSGVTDIVNTMPVDALSVPASATAAQKTYTLALATISQYMAATPGKTLVSALGEIQASSSVSTLLSSAMATFVSTHPAFSGTTLTAYSLAGVAGTINETAKTIAVTVPFGTNVTALVATFTTIGVPTVGGVNQISGTTANDFTTPKAYLVTAADTTTATYTVTVTVATNSAKAITAYSLAGVAGTITEPAHTIAVTVPFGTNVTALVATFTTTGAGAPTVGGVNQISGATANDFTTSKAYLVTAADTTTATYTVTVTVAPSSAKAITAFSFAVYPGATGTITEPAHTIAVTVPSGTNVTALVATFTTTGAGVPTVGGVNQISGTTANNFTAPVAYLVTAADASTATYTVTVSVAAGPPAVDLLSISTNNFVILASSMITEAAPINGAITGNVGVSPAAGSTILVACTEMLTGKVYQVDDAFADAACSMSGTVGGGANKTLVDQAVLDMGTAYTAASDPATPAGVGAGNLNVLGGILPAGTNFTPGVYTWGSNVDINGNITLTGGASDVWIFQMSGNLAIASCGSCASAADGAAIKVILSGGAVASNVFWQVGGATTTLGTYSTFNGNILTAPAGLIAIQTGAVLHGRALSGTSVALDGNTVGP